MKDYLGDEGERRSAPEPDLPPFLPDYLPSRRERTFRAGRSMPSSSGISLGGFAIMAMVFLTALQLFRLGGDGPEAVLRSIGAVVVAIFTTAILLEATSRLRARGNWAAVRWTAGESVEIWERGKGKREIRLSSPPRLWHLALPSPGGGVRFDLYCEVGGTGGITFHIPDAGEVARVTPARPFIPAEPWILGASEAIWVIAQAASAREKTVSRTADS